MRQETSDGKKLLIALALVTSAAVLPGLAIPLIMGAADECGGCPEECSLSDALPGINYSMIEVQARTWHRNRWARPFNFALRQ